MILVTGASGTTGQQVVKQLEENGLAVRALVRDAAKGAQRFGPGVEVVVGDLSNPATLSIALQGVDNVYLVSTGGPELARNEGNLIEAARLAGVKHVVKHSGLGADPVSPNAFSKANGEVEVLLKASGLAWTILQPHLFMQNFLGFDSIRAQGTIYAPMGDAKISLVDARDIAEAGAAILVDPAPHAGKTYMITGPEALSHDEIARSLSNAVGKTIQYVPISSADQRKSLNAADLPGWMIDAYVDLYQFFATGQAASVSPDFKTVTGQAGRTFAHFAEDHAQRFK